MATDGRTTADLELALRQGDRAAAEELTRRTYRRIHASLLRWCRDPTEAHDLTQETYRRAWQGLATFRGDAKFSTWLHRIAYTTFLNSLRGQDRLRSLEHGDALDAVDPEPTPRAVSEANQRQHLLREAVDRLDEPFRGTVIAHYWQELTVAELAAAEDITTVAIRKRLDKARRLLAEYLPTEVRSSTLEATR